MARLIPRKQIEEQQNITGSLTIGQNVFVGNDAVVTGSIFVSQSFFFGSSTSSKNEITGSVFLTGSLTIDGQLRTSAPNTVLAVTSSNAILSVDTQRYAGILAKDFGANLPTLYVSSTDGDDTNDGRSIQYPLRTIKRAAQLATPGYDGRYGFDTGSRYNGYVIKVQAGTYLEDNPVILPSNTTIWGAGLRITKINAKNPTEDLFWVNSGCYVAEVTVGGLRLYPDQINPEKGFGFAFQPGAFITTSPYVQNCSQISNQENSFTELYEDIPPGGGGLYVNGDVINPDSPLASMVLDAYTQISPNGVGCLVNGRGFIQLVSFFNNFSYYAIRVNNGGHATLNNSNISFGLYGMYASGSRLISGSGGNTDARDRVRASYSVIVDVLNKGIEEGLPSVTTLNTDEGIKVTAENQYFTSAEKSAPQFIADEISADFKLVSAIVESGTANYPTLLARSSNKGYGFDSPYNILGAEQITSSISASVNDLNHISQSYGVILGIFANGTGSYDFKANTEDNIKVTSNTTTQPAIVASDYITGSISSSFETVINILKNGVSAIPKVVSNNSSSIKVTNFEQFTTGESSSLTTINAVSSSFSIIYNIVENGTGSAILDVPTNHKTSFVVTNTNSSSYHFDGLGENPTLTLFRGFTYKFYVSASEAVGGVNYPFWIRTKKVSGIENTYDYGSGVVNNGDSVGNITFTVPYDAPNKLYYISSKNANLAGEFSVVNSSVTPVDLIAKTLTYPPLVSGSSIASEDVNIINAYDQLIGNKTFIQEETVAFISSSWSGFNYDQTKCKRDVGYIIDAVANDLLYSGNDKSITAGRYYYEYPSNATTSELAPTLTAVKYASGLAQKVVGNIQLVDPSNDKDSIAQCIVDNREFVQAETIAFLSSSWSGGDGFYYNEAKCKRDVGYILDAVSTDLKYGGNERSIQAGYFYYKYPSAATVAGVPSSANQLEQTLTGIRYAAGVVKGLVQGKTFTTASQSTQSAVDLLRKNKVLIQDETIQFINVAYPQLKYNTTKCRRDVGYIIDAIITDLLYGGNERSATAGHNYYNYPSVATSIQKKETSGGIRYSKIIGDYIVQNIILDTPKIVNNDEKGIKVTQYDNVTSLFGGTDVEYNLISSSFDIVEGIIKRGTDAIPAILAKSTNTNWGINTPLNVTNNIQFRNSYTTPNEVDRIDEGFNIVTSIIAGGLNAEPTFTSSLKGLIKVTDVEQVKGIPATNLETASISSSFGYIEDIIINGTGSIQSFTLNTDGNVKVTSTSLVGGTPATIYQSDFVSSSMGTIVDIITNGLNVAPNVIDNTQNNISVSGTSQYTNTLSANPEDIDFISQSISIVTNIIEFGEGASPIYVDYTTTTSDANTLAAYDILTNNIQFIQDETIAYLSSSWSGFDYNESLCRRDLGYIINGAAEDLIHNANSASLTNGLAYYEFPSQATGSQLAQTLEGINYASKLAQKLVQNIIFNATLTDNQNAASLLKDNKVFIQNETIAYMSSSWGSFDYNEAKCRRDIGYIIDAVATDMIYGGNERTIEAGTYYYLYPSQANASQLQQTNDAISYASRLAQKVVMGDTFTSANTNALNASNLLSANRNLIAEEVVAYVSSSWSGVQYDESKCKRDVGYLIDAVRTDLVYGGNERSSIAGLYYYLFPSSATVAGIPSSTAQLDPTITGISYGSRLAQNIILNKTLISPSQAVLDARELVKANTSFVQQNTIDYISETYPKLDYNKSKCYRDVKFIIDGVLTDLVYGGNERSITSGEFYYLYPNLATTKDQVYETVDALNFAKELTKLIATEGIAIENGFDDIINIIASASYAPIVTNTESAIKATNELQYTSELSANQTDYNIVSSSFGNVINIIENGVNSIPTIVSSSFKGVSVIGGFQITSSLEADKTERGKVNDEFDTILNIVENGLGAIGDVIPNTIDLVKVTNYQQVLGGFISQSIINDTTSSFDIVSTIIESGTGSMPVLINNAESLVKVTGGSQWTTATPTTTLVNTATASIDNIINIIVNGLGAIPTNVYNTENNIRIGSAPIAGTAATQIEATTIGGLFDIVSGIVKNGTGSMATLIPYTTPSVDTNVLNAYSNLKANIAFIQNETIAYLSSSWSTASYDEAKCRRDVGLIVSGAAEDLLWNSNSASLMSGKFYYLYPSQAQTAQLDQTLDGINYAKRLAEKIVLNTTFVQPTATQLAAKALMVNNKSLIANEVVAYISSSWTIDDNASDPYFYNEAKCKRDVGYVIDAVATDLVYGGNERSNKSGEFYYKYPSQVTGYQLDQTIDGIRYAKNIIKEILNGNVLVNADTNKLDARTLIDANKTFIANEVVAFVSSSWRGFEYNEVKCKRDVGYILDAVKTDLVYGGNERSRQAGEYYYRYPSQATGAELAPTLTGVKYAKELLVEVLKGNQLSVPSTSKQIAYDLLIANKTFIQNQTIANINAQLTTFDYSEAKCRRDVGYIVDAVATDILYGGNERATEAGRYYYLFPSLANQSQLTQTLDGILYAKDISHKIVSNEFISVQITSSISPNYNEIQKVGNEFDIAMDIIANGLNVLPTLVTNNTGSIKVTDFAQYSSSVSIPTTLISNVDSDFDTILNIIENGTGSLPNLVKNVNSLVRLTDTPQYSSSIAVSSSKANSVTGSFNRVIDIVTNGTGSLPTKVLNSFNNIKVTSETQYVGTGSGTFVESTYISSSIALVANIVANGTGSTSVIPYTSKSTNSNVIDAYNVLKQNIPFIQSETIAYLSSSWAGFDYNENKCKRDIAYIVSGAAEDLLWNSNSSSLNNGYYYYKYPSQAETTQLNQTLDGIKYASELAQKVVLNTLFVEQSEQNKLAYNLLVNNKEFIQNETIQYISSSWTVGSNSDVPFIYNEAICSRDVAYIIDAAATDLLYGGNERSIEAGYYYYKYPSQTTNAELDPTITGIRYASNLSNKLIKGGIFQKVSQNKLFAKDLIINNKQLISEEVVAFVSHSWNGFQYNENKCKRDVGYILDAVVTDMIYGGNERSIEAGYFYYKYPSQATGAELAPTLTGIRYAKGLTELMLKNTKLIKPKESNQTAYNLLVSNREFIQNETMQFVNSAWSFYKYNKAKCRRDVGYMIDAVATDILYGGNERVREAGRYYYLYPSLATVGGNGQSAGELGQTLDGVRYAKGLAQHIVKNELLKHPTQSEKAGYDLLVNNKSLIQKETIAFLSSSWSGVDGFSYNEASCSRDVAYIIDNVATDLLYGGNERSSKAGEYYYLYPSKAIVKGSASADAQIGQTIDGVKFVAGMAGNVISNIVLHKPTNYVQSAVALLKQNKTLIQYETIQFIDAFYPNLRYAKAKCRRDVGYIIDAISTDLFYGGNERSITAGDYYYRYPNLATTKFQVSETVGAIKYAKALVKKVAQNIKLVSPSFVLNTDGNIKATNTNQYTSSINVNTAEISKISSSFSIVTDIIGNGLEASPTKVLNTEAGIKVSELTATTSSINGGDVYADLVTSSFNLVRDIIYYGENGTPDALARNYDYGFELSTPNLLHISSTEQTQIAGTPNAQDYDTISSAYTTIIDIVTNGTGSTPELWENSTSSINVTGGTPYQAGLAGTTSDINKIGSGFETVMGIIEGVYPTLVSNTYEGIKITSTPQLISGSGAERLQAKLISSSFALVVDIIASGTGSKQFVSSSYPNANTNPKVQSAYNLLLGNKNMIIDETIAYMSSSWSTFDYNETKCRRDLGYIIDGAAFDLIYNGNSASFVNGKYYYDIPSQATDVQLDQTITALKYASGISEKVVKNIELLTPQSETWSAYTSLIENKQFIQNEAIAYVSSSWRGFDYNETKCRRDVGYIVDAVATDLLYGGNERSIVAGDYYYRYPSQATTSELQPTLDGINYAKGVAMNLAANTGFVTTDAGTQFSYDILLANKEFIQNETIAFVNAKYPNLYYNETSCRRDVGYIIDAVITDLLYGGNERQSIAGKFYYLYPSLATNVQLEETTAAIDYARRLSLEIIQNNVIDTPQPISNTFNNIKVTNVPQYVSASSATQYEVGLVSSSFSIVNTIIANGLVATPTFISNVSESVKVTPTSQIGGIAATQTEADYVSSSISIVTDIIQNGTGSFPVLSAYGAASTDPNVINAYNNLIQNISFIQSETIAYISSSWSFFNYNEASCSRDVAYIVGGAAEDLLHNSTSASMMNGYYYFLYPSKATVVGDGDGIGQLGQTLDGVNYASRLAQQIVLGTTFVSPSTERKVAAELLKLNKSFIAAETVAYISSSWVTGSNSDVAFTYNDLSCSRDVNYILDNVATDILYGGNERTIKAGSYYFLYPSQATGSQIDETLEGIRYAGELAQKVVLNTIFTQPNVTASAVYKALKANKPFIQSETIAFVSSSWSSLNYNEAKCKRDVGYIVDAVATDILYGGNQRSATAGQYYYKYPSQATNAQIDSTLNAIDFAGGVAKNVITNKTFVTASQSISASVELLKNNKGFIQNETMAWLDSAWNMFNYDKDKCKRDVGYIVDGIATDLLYGGNERSIMSGQFYFKYPNKATLLGNGESAGQLKQTVEGINYASRITQKVAQNVVFQTASLEVSASFDLLRKNKTFIAAETIAYVSSSWSGVYYNEASCSRDVKYIIDAAATDILYGGTERAITAGTYYYIFPSKATKAGVPSEANQLDPTITGVRYAGRLASRIVKNPTFTQVSNAALNSRELLVGNKKFVQKETIAFLSSSWSTLQYNEVSCSRDLGFIIDAVATDIVYGGNERAIQAGSYYYYIPSVAISDSYTDNGTVGQKMQTLDGINFARGVAEKTVGQTQLVYPGKKRREAVARLLAAKDELKKKAIGYTNGAFPYLVYNEASCSRDTGLIVDALATDLTYGGNERGIRVAESYWKGQYGSAAAVVTSQKLETLETNRYLRTRAEFIAAGAPLESFGSLIVATGIDYSYNGAGVTFKALPPNQGGSGVANPIYEITQLAGGRIFFTSGNQDGDFRIGTGLSINQATGTLVGRTFSKSLFTLVTPFSLALQI